MNLSTQQERAEAFYQLHQNPKILLLPNIWEPLGALMLEKLKFPAVATASYATAWTHGVHDGENISLNLLFPLLKRISKSISIPLSVDFESCFARDDKELQQNILALLDTGIIGLNFEDTDKKTGDLIPLDIQCNRIGLIKKVARQKEIPLFINVRTDAFLQGDKLSSNEKLQESILRGKAYKDAGADGLYPILMQEEAQIKKVLREVDLPLNLNTMPQLPDLKKLEDWGVSRLSLGPSFLKIGFQAMKNLATDLQAYKGLQTIRDNTITSDYLDALISESDN